MYSDSRKINTTPEWDALVLLTGPQASLFNEKVDWKTLIDLACRHKVCLLLAHGLAQAQVSIPDAQAREYLAATARNLTLRAISHARLVAQIADAFQIKKVPISVLKGAPLSQIIHGNSARRDPGDIDIIIPPGHLADAACILQSLQFKTKYTSLLESPTRRDYLVKCRKHLDFVHASGALECHWRIVHSKVSMPTDPERLFGQETVQIGNQAVPTPERVHMFVYLCCHGIKDFWRRLKWLNDIRWMLQDDRLGPEYWNSVVKYAESIHMTRVIASTIIFVRDIDPHVMIPHALEQLTTQNNAAHNDASILTKYLIDTGHLLKDPPVGIIASYCQLSQMSRLSARDHVLPVIAGTAQILQPSADDLLRVNLPKSLRWAYSILRILRIASQGFAKKWRHR